MLLHSGLSLILRESTYDMYTDFLLTNILGVLIDLKDLFLLNKKKGGVNILLLIYNCPKGYEVASCAQFPWAVFGILGSSYSL